MKKAIYMFLFESMFASSDAVAEEFGLEEADSILEEMAETDAIVQTGNGYWKVAGYDDLDDDAAEAVADDAFGSSPQESTPQAPQEAPEPSESVSEAPEKPATEDERLERARANFRDHAENATSEQGRAWAQAKLDALG